MRAAYTSAVTDYEVAFDVAEREALEPSAL